MRDAMFHVYELIDPRDGAVFYVGKGKGNRRFDHEREARAGKTSAKCERIRAILASGAEPIANVVESFADELSAYEAEAARIASYGLESLTNVSPGGGGGFAAPRDPVKEARDCIKSQGDTIRRVIHCKTLGLSITWQGADFVKLGYDLAMTLRQRAGAEYFDKHVWGV